MGDASRHAGSPRGAGRRRGLPIVDLTAISIRESREALFLCMRLLEIPSEDLFAILGYEAELGWDCLDSACLMVKAVFSKLRFTVSILATIPTLDSLLLVVNRNLWLLNDPLYLVLKGINMG